MILHENETTALQATLAHIQSFGGVVYALNGQGRRNVTFKLAGTSYLIDPNRIFTSAGVERTLDLNNPVTWRKNRETVVVAVQSAAREILRQMGSSAAIVAVHNNQTNSAQSFTSDPLTADICWAGGKDTHNFYYVTCWKDYAALGLAGYTVVRQDTQKAHSGQGDGSLSDYCGQHGIRYINVEAAFGDPSYQAQMLMAADQSLGAGAYAINEENAKRFSGWLAQTLATAKNRPVLIADKFSYTLLFFKQGQLKCVYPMALGQNPITAKRQEGDACTPEGKYRVINKLAHSQYYKAFLINYPNEQDRVRFLRAKQRQEIPTAATIGGLVEIHGRGIGQNWTLGCMALNDRDMDQLWPDINLGTAVTIVAYLPVSAKIQTP
jgi:hypothetical protein